MSTRLVSLVLGSTALVGAGCLLVPLTALPSTPATLPPAPPAQVASLKLPVSDPPVVRGLKLPPLDLPPQARSLRLPPLEPEGGETYELTLNLASADSVERMLADIHIDERERRRVDRTLGHLLGDRQLATGEQINLVLQTVEDPNAGPRLVSLSVRPRPEREFIITRKPGGRYSGEEKVFTLSPRFVRVNATLKSSILEDGTQAGAPAAAVNEFIRALSYEVDFQRELRAGQRFFLLLEQLVTSDGTVANPGRLLAGELVLNSRLVSLVRFRPSDGADQFYNLRGESIARSFLRTPLASWRITSEYGMRQHPILGYGAMHRGVDFAAPEGTPVLASAAGQVTFADTEKGHGLFVKVDHGSEIGTGYAHLSRLAPGIAPGAAVRQGQLIGFVGSTGRSTGPHLHYEFYRNGKTVNPLAEKFGVRQTLAGDDLERFRTQVREYVSQFKQAPSVGNGSTVIAPKAPAPAAADAPATAAAVPADAPQRQAAEESRGGYTRKTSGQRKAH